MIKKFDDYTIINESLSWSEDYTDEFKDLGFDFTGNSQLIQGRYKGKLNIKELMSSYIEMIDRISDEFEITHSKHSFNTASGVYSFDIEINDISLSSIKVKIDGEELILFPYILSYLYVSSNFSSLYLSCKTEDGIKKGFSMDVSDGYSRFAIGNKTKDVKIDKDEFIKIYSMIKDKIIIINPDAADNIHISPKYLLDCFNFLIKNLDIK